MQNVLLFFLSSRRSIWKIQDCFENSLFGQFEEHIEGSGMI